MTQINEEPVDELYRGRMPNFLSEAKPDDRLRFYEVNLFPFPTLNVLFQDQLPVFDADIICFYFVICFPGSGARHM